MTCQLLLVVYFRIMKTQASLLAILAAALYALNVPVAKMLLDHTTATMLAAFLYLGAGIGMIAFARPTPDDAPITAQDAKYVVAMVVLDIAAPHIPHARNRTDDVVKRVVAWQL